MKVYDHIQVNKRLAISFTIQSTPSRRPQPDLALQPIAPQCLVLTVYSSRKSLICQGVRLFGISCLLQNTINVAPISFSCFKRAWSSFFVSSSLNLSELSTTHITPSVCSKQLRQQERIVFCPPTSHTFSLQFQYCKDLILKPRVGEISLMSSPLNFLMMVVLPALSRPSTSSLIYFSCSLAFLTIDMNPILQFYIFKCEFNLRLEWQFGIILQHFITQKKTVTNIKYEFTSNDIIQLFFSHYSQNIIRVQQNQESGLQELIYDLVQRA